MRAGSRCPTWPVGLVVTALTLFVAVQAQSTSLAPLSQLPRCALECLADMEPSLPCAATDLECLCNAVSLDTKGPAYACLQKGCTVKESLLTRNVYAKTCGKEDRDRGPIYVTVAIVFTTLSSLAVLQRFAIKFWFRNLTVGLDDCATLLAAAVQMAATILATTNGVSSGLGRDVWTLSYDQITRFSQILYVYTLLYFIDIATVKLAFLFLYLRIFPKRNVKRLLWMMVALVVVYGLVFFLVGVFQCRPISHYWNRWDGEHQGTCMDVSAVAWANGAIGIAIDLCMMSIPFAQLRKLNLTLKRKLGVFAMFGVGLFVTIVSILRLQAIMQHGPDDPNATWVKVELAIWSTVEINVGLICACMPSLRMLFVLIYSKVSGTNAYASKTETLDYNGMSAHALGFGTIARSVAEPRKAHLPIRSGEIHMERTYEIKDERLDSGHDEVKLVPLKEEDSL